MAMFGIGRKAHAIAAMAFAAFWVSSPGALAQPLDGQAGASPVPEADIGAPPAESTDTAGSDAPAQPTEDQPQDTAPPTAPEAGLSADDPPGADARSAKPRAEPLKGDAARVWKWVVNTDDNTRLPFAIVDKLAARIFVFDRGGNLLAAAPALVGIAAGDDSADGVGDRALSAIPPNERTTPAGRFLTRFGAAPGHRQVLWVDYTNSISLHPVVTSNPSEHRLKRIRSRTAADHRITFGCINVPAAFYKHVVLKTFAKGVGVVYVLPETHPLEEVFPLVAINGESR
jgi:hypothetical protein